MQINKFPFGLNKGLIFFLSFISLWAGAMVYIYLRISQPVFIRYIEFAGLGTIFDVGKNFFSGLNLPDWLLYTLPSGLWAFSYSLIITGMWWLNSSWLKYFWIASVVVMVIAWEVFQLFMIIPGTFSFGDIFSGLFGASIGIFLGIKLVKLNNYEKEIY